MSLNFIPMLVYVRESICVKSGGGGVGIYRLLMEHARIISRLKIQA